MKERHLILFPEAVGPSVQGIRLVAGWAKSRPEQATAGLSAFRNCTSGEVELSYRFRGG